MIILVINYPLSINYMKKYLFSFCAIFVFSIAAAASGPSLWTVDSRTDVLKGDAHGVSIDQNGAITPAPRLTEVFKTGQSYIWSSAVDANGNIFLGTGGEGKIFRVDTNGKGTLFTDLNELNVSAIVIGNSGEL